jgi:hypothetical protein
MMDKYTYIRILHHYKEAYKLIRLIFYCFFITTALRKVYFYDDTNFILFILIVYYYWLYLYASKVKMISCYLSIGIMLWCVPGVGWVAACIVCRRAPIRVHRLPQVLHTEVRAQFARKNTYGLVAHILSLPSFFLLNQIELLLPLLPSFVRRLRDMFQYSRYVGLFFRVSLGGSRREEFLFDSYTRKIRNFGLWTMTLFDRTRGVRFYSYLNGPITSTLATDFLSFPSNTPKLVRPVLPYSLTKNSF